MREWDGTELWPAKLSQKELSDRFNAFWKLK
jgi:hypothetical protein